MKATTLVLCSLFCTGMAFARQDKVPQVVTNAFSKEHPQATEVKWEKEDQGFEVSFKENDQSQSIVFDAAGSKLETETEISADQLPGNVREFIATHHKGKKIDEAAKIVDAKGVVTYEAEIGGKDIIFDQNGKQVK